MAMYRRWENSGSTPTIDLKMWVSWGYFEGGPMPDDFPFPDLGDTSFDSATAIGPRAQVTTTAFLLPLEQALQIMHGQRTMYIWGWADYRDIFANTPRRRTEFCNQILVSPIPGPQPRLMVEFRNFSRHNRTT